MNNRIIDLTNFDNERGQEEDDGRKGKEDIAKYFPGGGWKSKRRKDKKSFLGI